MSCNAAGGHLASWVSGETAPAPAPAHALLLLRQPYAAAIHLAPAWLQYNARNYTATMAAQAKVIVHDWMECRLVLVLVAVLLVNGSNTAWDHSKWCNSVCAV